MKTALAFSLHTIVIFVRFNTECDIVSLFISCCHRQKMLNHIVWHTFSYMFGDDERHKALSDNKT